jgi:hypothetical protein
MIIFPTPVAFHGRFVVVALAMLSATDVAAAVPAVVTTAGAPPTPFLYHWDHTQPDCVRLGLGNLGHVCGTTAH